jgi:hypothetical protein
MKMHLAGKTEEARADMARLALIRKQREEAAKKRDEERKGKCNTWSSCLRDTQILSTDYISCRMRKEDFALASTVSVACSKTERYAPPSR